MIAFALSYRTSLLYCTNVDSYFPLTHSSTSESAAFEHYSEEVPNLLQKMMISGWIVEQFGINYVIYLICFSLTDTSAPVVPSHRPPPAFATIDTTPVRSGDSLQRRTSGLRTTERRDEEDRSEWK